MLCRFSNDGSDITADESLTTFTFQWIDPRMSEAICERGQSKEHILRLAGTLEGEKLTIIRSRFGNIIDVLRNAQVEISARAKRENYLISPPPRIPFPRAGYSTVQHPTSDADVDDQASPDQACELPGSVQRLEVLREI